MDVHFLFGVARRCDHEKIMASIRFLNKREAAIHTVGVEAEPHGEVLLRRGIEENGR